MAFPPIRLDLGSLDRDAQGYWAFHQSRFRFLCGLALDSLQRLRPDPDSGEVTVLDIGPSFEALLLDKIAPRVRLNTLGFYDGRFPTRSGEHFDFDLLLAADPARWPQLPRHDLVVIAEVIEHVPIAVQWLFRCVSNWLKPGGELILQTPNAVSLAKRLSMLCGRHPYMMISERPDHSTHFREYTAQELIMTGASAGFRVLDCHLKNYFRYMQWQSRLYSRICGVLPAQFRDGITIRYVKT